MMIKSLFKSCGQHEQNDAKTISRKFPYSIQAAMEMVPKWGSQAELPLREGMKKYLRLYISVKIMTKEIHASQKMSKILVLYGNAQIVLGHKDHFQKVPPGYSGNYGYGVQWLLFRKGLTKVLILYISVNMMTKERYESQKIPKIIILRGDDDQIAFYQKFPPGNSSNHKARLCVLFVRKVSKKISRSLTSIKMMRQRDMNGQTILRMFFMLIMTKFLCVGLQW